MVSRILDKDLYRQLLKDQQVEELRQTIAATDPADLADILEELDSDEVEEVFKILDNETASEVIVEMDNSDVEDVVDTLPPERIAGMIQEMAPDDAADFFSELDEDDQQNILPLLNNHDRAQLEELIEYSDDTAGGLMTPEVCAVSSNASVEQAIAALAKADFSDPVTMVFVVDKSQRLIGSIHISELIAKPHKAKVMEIADKDIVFAHVNDSANDIALKFRKYDLYVMPVVDDQQHLVGRITADDIMDFMDDEAADDIAKMAGAPDIEAREDSPLRIVKLRLPWLMITMFTGSLVSIIIQRIVNIHGAERLAAFVPVILGMGGNTGMQASAVTIRSIALGEIKLSRLFNIFSREFFVGAMMGIVCGLLAAGTVWVNLAIFNGVMDSTKLLKMMFAVGFSMLIAMAFAAFNGTLLPIILNQMKIDPAVATGPFISTGNDLSASLIYLCICSLLLS